MKDIFLERRKKFLQKLQKKFSNTDKGVVLLFSGFEDNRYVFKQESSFYYLTGVNEPGIVFCIYLDGREAVFVPNYGRSRSQWMSSDLSFGSNVVVKELGKKTTAYWMKPFFYEEEYETLIGELNTYLGSSGLLFSLLDENCDTYFSSIYRLKNVFDRLQISFDKLVDVSDIVHAMRRKKDSFELELMYKAIQITCDAHNMVLQNLDQFDNEKDVRAEIVKVFIKNDSKEAFPSIVATGKNTTVLHYLDGNKKLEKGDLLVVDIGADYSNYCADLTRTYVVKSDMTSRQKEIYAKVLEVQQYAYSLAKPGMFLQNPLAKEKSIHHLVEKYFEKEGLKKYFVHGIGHFLGLDVHDVGDAAISLDVGDVFTIEPGLYIPEENIGVRIEDDFVITQDGCVCMSAELPK